MNERKWDLYSLFYNVLLKTVENERRHLYRNLALHPNVPLDVYVPGCGTGLDFPYLPAKSRVLGIDFSQKMLEKAEKQAGKLTLPPLSLQIQLRRSYAELSDLPDNSKDLVILHLILAVTERPQDLLNEAVRVLKPGGIVSVWDKFLPDDRQASCLRRYLNTITTKLATSINLQVGPLLANLPVRIIRREFRLAGLMQHLILQKTFEDL
ncbi:MAG TPA: class I SAM-dependent methyltransferase [Pasteurellaceae bacterium]|nr:class I SAM-dependent methyltransferase [Pasteurellaceae bacterium]